MSSSSRAADPVGAHVEDPRLRVRRVRHDPRLGPGERDRAVAEVVDRHGAQRAGHPLARRQQHVHLARVRVRRDLLGVGDQAVGLLAARAQDRHDAVPGLALGDDPLGGALEAFGVGDRRAPELHDDGCGDRGEGGKDKRRGTWVGHEHAPLAPPGPGRRAPRRPAAAHQPPAPTRQPRPSARAGVPPPSTRRPRRPPSRCCAEAATPSTPPRRRRGARRGRAVFLRHRGRWVPDRLLRARRQGPHDRLARDGAGGDERSSFVGLQSFESQRVSGMSVGVPGSLYAWEKALDEYGTWPLRRALQPGDRRGAAGFTVDQTFSTRPTRPRRSSPTSRPPRRCTSIPTARRATSAPSSGTPISRAPIRSSRAGAPTRCTRARWHRRSSTPSSTRRCAPVRRARCAPA